jgi:hypothetical protein
MKNILPQWGVQQTTTHILLEWVGGTTDGQLLPSTEQGGPTDGMETTQAHSTTLERNEFKNTGSV